MGSALECADRLCCCPQKNRLSAALPFNFKSCNLAHPALSGVEGDSDKSIMCSNMREQDMKVNIASN